MNRKCLFFLLFFCLTTAGLQADFIVADSSNTKIIERYTDSGQLLWSINNGRSASSMTLNQAGTLVFFARQGTDRMLTTFSVDGTYYDDRFLAGTHTVDCEWLDVDLNNDGRHELAVSTRNDIYIVSVDDTDTAHVTYTTLASYTVADSDGSNGTGGNLLLGDDYNHDGVRDLIATKGGNSSGNRINIWDPVTGNRLAWYPAEQCRGIGHAILGPDQNNDGIEDLWVCSHYRDQIEAYDLADNGAYIGSVDLGGTIKGPQDIVKTPAGMIYISTRFASYLSEAGLGANYANVIKYNPAAGAATLILDTAEARYSAICYLPCARYAVADINQDCSVDTRDLLVMANQWLQDSDPAVR